VAVKRFDPEAALDRALDAFWRGGYEATSAQDLVDAMGINRGSLYDTFGSKQALYRRALERYRERSREEVLAILEGPGSFEERIRRLLEVYADQLAGDGQRRGCLLVNACGEASMADAALAGDLAAGLDELRGPLADGAASAQRAGEASGERSADALADVLLTTILGLRVLGKVTADRERLQHPIDAAVELVRP
jgi:TetR/AcrR family transcriptional repressor of nem operon